MSSIRAIGSLKGTISGSSNITGALSGSSDITGVLSVPQIVETLEVYTGAYEVTPSASEAQILNTANKTLANDITVNKIPYYETSNTSNGKTVYIAKEVE